MPLSCDGTGVVNGPNARENVVVCVRARPLDSDEEDGVWRVDKEQSSVVPTELHPSLARRAGSSTQASTDEDDGSHGLTTYDFCYDNLVLGHEQTTALYEANVYPVVRAAMDGYNGTVFAYGQTGSGKTYTMTGTEADPGVITRAVKDVFQMIRENPTREFLLRVSYLEIYNETLRDLLAGDVTSKKKLKPPRIFEEKGRVVLGGMQEEIVTTPREVFSLLEQGQRNRHIGATDWNTRSSRSHCVFQITIESRELDNTSQVRVSQLNLIDLAGSERAASQMDRRKEGAYINKSLLTLGTVIAKLTETPASNDVHVPYRDSKLTRLLQTSLSGDARVAVICTIALDKASAIETLSTLKFGRRCKMVVTKAKRQMVMDDKALLEKYTQEIQDLRARLESSSSDSDNVPHTPTSDADAEREAAALEVASMQETRQDLRKQIDHLTRLILTSRTVAAQTPARSPLGHADADPYASPARRGPRMSDLPARYKSGHDDADALRREIAELRSQQLAEREAHKRVIRALEEEVRDWEESTKSARKQNQGAERELLRLREEHATDAAHREFRELVSPPTSQRDDECKDAAHLQARVAALERALSEERAMRDLSSLPERPLALPMESRSGMTPPCVPIRSRSQGGSPVGGTAESVSSLQRELAEQKALVSTLSACVQSWQSRVKQQADMISRLAALVVDDEEMDLEAPGLTTVPDTTKPKKTRHSGIRPSDVVQGRAKIGEVDSEHRNDPPSGSKMMPGKLSPSALGLSEKSQDCNEDVPRPSTPPATNRSAASSTFQTKAPTHAFTPERRVKEASKPTGDVKPLQAQVQVPQAVRPEPRRSVVASARLAPASAPARALPSPPRAVQPLPTPPSGPTRSLPTPPNSSVKALRASLMASADKTSMPRAHPAPSHEQRKRPPPSPADAHAALPAMPRPPSKRSAATSAPDSHAKLRARLSAYTAVASEQVPPPPRSQSGMVRGLALKPVQSMMQIPEGRRPQDAAILRELNELKSMPRVESSRVMYMPQTLPSDASMARLSASNYKTDASAYYI